MRKNIPKDKLYIKDEEQEEKIIDPFEMELMLSTISHKKTKKDYGINDEDNEIYDLEYDELGEGE